ncbi:hypothetical protein JYT44_00580 [Caldithrix abyssi]|nr:hypothetical protein [Caldithrix abyssi]
MNLFITLLKREWWEWKRVIFWTLGVYTFLLLLTLVPINRLSNEFESWVEEERLWLDDDMSSSIEFKDGELTEEEKKRIKIAFNAKGIDITSDNDGVLDSLLVFGKQTAKEKLAESPLAVIKPYSIGIGVGFTLIQFIVVFIALFYFSDSLYKERSNNSTDFFRSQPVNDHLIIFSKLKAGGIGVIGLTLTMLMILLVYSRIALLTVSRDVWDIISGPLSEINLLGLFGDLILIQVVSLLWLSPLILFLIIVSATVKNRPLIIGVGVPILLAIMFQIIYGDNAIVSQIGDIFGAIAGMIKSQNLISEMKVVPVSGVDIFGSFWGALFSVRTLISIMVSGLIYTGTWAMYRKNIPTN